MQAQKWLKQGICRPSNSTYAAPAFIVEQPFHESTPRRVVIDYSRTINSITKLDPHPIDHMEYVIKRIVEKCYSSKMDVKSAFSTIRKRETDIFKTGFVTLDGHYEFLRMPIGVTNDPSTMTRAIKLAYEHLAPHNVNTYIDDISTSHDDFSYHLKVLYKILEATRNAGFKLTPGKTQLVVSEIALFGRILPQDGECPDPDRTASVQSYSSLKSIHEVRSFLGFANQFRKHIQNYAVIAKPLTSVLKGLKRKTSNATIILTDDQQRTFETLKTAITTIPILAYFKQGLPTVLETDASYSGLGAVLSQDQNGKRRVIEYASRTLKDAETRYHSNELKCIAVHWALTEKFRLYLLGHKFQLITDNYTTAYVDAKSAVNRKFSKQVKRANGIIVSTLKKLTDKNPDKWDELLPNALLAINTTKQNSTKKLPFYLLFGYEPRLPRELHIGSFIDDTPREDQLDLLILARAEAANNVYEAYLENKHRFDLHRRSHSFKAGDLVLYDWPKQGDHKLSPIFKGPFVIVRPVGAVCYEIKSRTLQNKFIKVVHVQHLCPYFK
ncbi:retrovirus-related Pol polyprotein from transposon opus [Trichonephila clavipes]|nr:retrovirus-related Pol polyprotein from transposon opus [Trichonephila clavipes]